MNTTTSATRPPPYRDQSFNFPQRTIQTHPPDTSAALLTIHRMDPVGALLCSFPQRVFTVASPKSPILTSSSWRKMSVRSQGRSDITTWTAAFNIFVHTVHTYVRTGTRCLNITQPTSYVVRPATMHTGTTGCRCDIAIQSKVYVMHGMPPQVGHVVQGLLC